MMMRRTVGCVVAGLLSVLGLVGPSSGQATVAPRVEIAWNRYYSFEEIEGLLRSMRDAYPERVELRETGQSLQGRPIWLAIVNDPKTGPHETKPAMYIDGSVHANEVQATEVVLYAMWKLLESQGRNGPLTELLAHTSFYFVPVVNPDGRVYWFEEANSPHSSRRNQRPSDRDLDGAVNEDPPDDLDGDGSITRMWKRDPAGRWIRDREDPRIFRRVGPDETGEWTSLGQEGIDNDGDGRVNEDGPYGDDMNRNWPADWKPTYVQGGAGPYPLSAPETSCIARFMMDHPNIGAVQSYHNTGGMILRGPGAAYRKEMYPREDLRVYDELARIGVEMLPYYRYLIIEEDLYRVHGGFVTWAAEHLGVFSFTNELWTTGKYFQRDVARPNEEQQWIWRDKIAFGELFTPYTEVEHPQHGTVLVGGPNKWASRSTPVFMLEEECHRNFAFTMFHADQMARVGFERTGVVDLGDGAWQVTVAIRNTRVIPTRSRQQSRSRIGAPDLLTVSVSGEGRVVAGGTVERWWATSMRAVRHEPERLVLDRGIGGRATRLFRFVVEGARGDVVAIRCAGEKFKDIETAITLEPAD